MKAKWNLPMILFLLLSQAFMVNPAGAFSESIALLEQLPNQVIGYPSDPAFCEYNIYRVACSLAQNFMVPAGESVTIDQVQLWGAYAPLADPSLGASDYTDSFTVAFHPDDSGLPGTAIYEEHAVSAVREPTGQFIQQIIDEYRIKLTLAVPQTLTPGNYWVEIYDSNANSSTAGSMIFGWEYGDPDTLGMGLGGVAENKNGM
jgi:hypothetical protein